MGRGDADRGGGGPHGYRNYDGAWGLTGAAAQTAYLTRTAYWTGRFHARPAVARPYNRRGWRAAPFPAARPASECADARTPGADPALRRPHGAGGRRAHLAGGDRLRRSRASPTRSTASSRAAGTSSPLRQDRRPARRPADDRRRRDPARRLLAAALGGARGHRRPRRPALRRLARPGAPRNRPRREPARQGRHLAALPRPRLPDGHPRPHDVAALDLLGRPRPRPSSPRCSTCATRGKRCSA